MNLFLDSGAYSAWTKKTPVNIEEYGRFALKHLKHFEAIANLDVIPGEFGRKGSKAEVDESARQGYENYHVLLNMGIPKDKLIHIFHQDEDFYWLKLMIEEGMQYIGISPANDRTTQQKRDWLDKCMEYVTDKDGYPIVKFHAFGVTSIQLLRKYPWYCMTDSHKILTQRGFLGRKEITTDDKVLGYDSEGNCKWEKVKSIHIFNVENIIIRKFYGRFSAETTLNHNWLVAPRGGKDHSTIFKTTENIVNHDKIPRSGNYIDSPSKKKFSDALVKLVAWVFTDGSISFTENFQKQIYLSVSSET